MSILKKAEESILSTFSNAIENVPGGAVTLSSEASAGKLLIKVARKETGRVFCRFPYEEKTFSTGGLDYLFSCINIELQVFFLLAAKLPFFREIRTFDAARNEISFAGVKSGDGMKLDDSGEPLLDSKGNVLFEFMHLYNKDSGRIDVEGLELLIIEKTRKPTAPDEQTRSSVTSKLQTAIAIVENLPILK